MSNIFDRNMRTSDMLEVWDFSSHNLRKRLCFNKPNAVATLARACNLTGDMIGHLREPSERDAEIPEEVFENPEPNDFINLLIALQGKTYPQDILDTFGENRNLDKLSKKIRSRWNAYGDMALEESHPVKAEFEKLEKEMTPLLEALKIWVQTHRKPIEKEIGRMIKTLPKHTPNWKDLRRSTPELETLLTKSQLLQLKPEIEAIRETRITHHFLPQKSEDLGTALQNFTKKLKKFQTIFQEQNLNLNEVATDFLNYDCLKEKYQL